MVLVDGREREAPSNNPHRGSSSVIMLVLQSINSHRLASDGAPVCPRDCLVSNTYAPMDFLP